MYALLLIIVIGVWLGIFSALSFSKNDMYPTSLFKLDMLSFGCKAEFTVLTKEACKSIFLVDEPLIIKFPSVFCMFCIPPELDSSFNY